ncbi:MAG: hypothetical protein IJI54_09075 [Kiritimatiellae bacterium]|nr:hypothetical protein [Kiritimatiellia bacterium]
MKSMMVAVVAALAATFAFARPGGSRSVATETEGSSLCSTADTEIVKVKGRGVGADKAEALKDAYRDAVERAVGLYVDAEQLVKNEELVKDQILTQSNAYIDKYDVVQETTKPNGLVEIKILAEVRKRELTQKISDVMPEKRYVLSGGLKDTHARLTTQEKRNADGAALLEKALNEIGDPLLKCIDCSLASPEAVVGKIDETRGSTGSDNVLVNYLFKFEIDRQRFFDNVAKPLKEVLDQVAAAEPEEVSIQANVRSTCNVPEALATAREAADESSPNRHLARKSVRRVPCDIIEISDFSDRVQARENRRLSNRQVQVLLVVDVNKYGTVYTARKYVLDEKCSRLVKDWYQRVNDIYHPSAKFNLRLLDADGAAIFTDQINFHSGIDGRGISSMQITPWLRSPFDRRGTMMALATYEWEKFRLPKDVLPEVKDMKIEIVK